MSTGTIMILSRAVGQQMDLIELVQIVGSVIAGLQVATVVLLFVVILKLRKRRW